MDPIIEEDEPIETIQPTTRPTKPRPQTPVGEHSSRTESSNSPTDSDTSLAPAPVPLSPRSQRRVFDAHAFTPSRDIPREKLTNQPRVILWPRPEPKQCNYVLCSPELDEQYMAGHRDRPSLKKAQSTTGVEVEAELLKLTKRDSRPTGPLLRSVSLKVTDPPTLSSSACTASGSSNVENENPRPDSPVLGRIPSIRKPMFRTTAMPVENIPQLRVSLVPSGLKITPTWNQGEAPRSLQKPYETRMCSGCDRYITLTKTQYVCNDIGCNNRVCDRCYHIWLEAKWEGRIVTPERLRKAHTAAEFRERYAKGMLMNEYISLDDKIKYIGEGAAVAVGYGFADIYGQEHDIGYKPDPSRYKNFNLEPLRDFFGEEEVEMTQLESSETKKSCITTEVGPGEPASAHVDHAGPSNGSSVWGWDYASGKRDAAAAGRTAPALPELEFEYQPPTFSASPSPSTSSLTIISPTETVVGREESQRSTSPSGTTWTAGSSGSSGSSGSFDSFGSDESF
ncbi:hypothetical protein TWF730_004306 [Orbilia blumenaviensis]|uniref:Uncharacterized protein n=1 Tax=Orbilia blumenaviensis TaxID=1796055 RepID=A0AAV9U2U2_9PEZI